MAVCRTCNAPIKLEQRQDGGWNRLNMDGSVHQDARPAGGGGGGASRGRSPEERAEMIRMSALKSAAEFLGQVVIGSEPGKGPKSADVLATAKAWAEWVKGE